MVKREGKKTKKARARNTLNFVRVGVVLRLGQMVSSVYVCIHAARNSIHSFVSCVKYD